MRAIIACALLALAGCTHIPTKEYMFPDPPTDLMEVPQNLDKLPTQTDGTIDAKTALGTIVGNNTKSLDNSIQLLKLQNWILKTQKNIQSGGKTQ